jgi:hypothetical protein
VSTHCYELIDQQLLPATNPALHFQTMKACAARSRGALALYTTQQQFIFGC